MSLPLLLMAREQAERSEPAVRAAALMRIARVLARSNQDAAEQLLEKGITLAEEVDSAAADLLLKNAIYLAAAVSPKHALPLYVAHRMKDPFGSSVVGLVNAMAEHGHVRDAIAYLNDPLPGDQFPLHFVNNLAMQCHDDETRLSLLQAAIRAWKNSAYDSQSPREQHAGSAFAGLFSRYWNLLPPDVAAPVLKTLVQKVLSDESTDGRFPLTGEPGEPELTSEEHLLFLLMPALNRLEPDLARSLMERHPLVAAAAERFPLGMQSVYEGRRKYDPAVDDVMMVGDSAVIPLTEALANDFQAAFQEANDGLAKDSDPANPNEVPKDCWPSTREFRNILFKAGQHLGQAAEKYLDRIPDPDIRLFAQIELCAAIAGLPQIGGVTARQSTAARKRQVAELERNLGPILPDIRCPKCKWTPRAKNIWACKCGHLWNTFDTRGLCPACQYQWKITACPGCGATSPHRDWYRPE